MMNLYYKFFAGTYFFVQRTESVGSTNRLKQYAVRTIITISGSELFIWMFVQLYCLNGPPANAPFIPLALGIFAGLMTLNYWWLVRSKRYVEIVARYKHQRLLLMRIAAVVNFGAVGVLFAVPAILAILR